MQRTRYNISQFIYFCKTLYMFQTTFPSIIRSSKQHIQCQVFVRPLLLPATVTVWRCTCSFELLMVTFGVVCKQDCRIWCLERGRLWRSAVCDVSLANYTHRYAPPSLDGSLETRMMTSPTKHYLHRPFWRRSTEFRTESFVGNI